MKIQFSKYQGTGNDFVIIDGLTQSGHNKIAQHDVRKICNRNFGVGADGLIILVEKSDFDFDMLYYNSDGLESTMCGNGGRCAVAFAQSIGLIADSAKFNAIDGVHHAKIEDNNIALGMIDVNDISIHETFYQLDTGSPHYVTFVDNTSDINVNQEGALIRNSPLFSADGINVNFVQEISDNELIVRTYERGVEAETLSCGTGVTAASLVQMIRKDIDEVNIETLGGNLLVRATNNQNSFTNIELIGPAEFVFQGELEIDG